MYTNLHAWRKSANAGTSLVLALIISLTLVSIQRAYAAVAVANALITSRVTAPGAVSAGILIPVINQPVLVGASTTAPATLRGTASGAVTRHQVSGSTNTISSAFVNAAGTSPATLAIEASAVGTDMAYLSPGGVNTANTIEIGPTSSQIRVENDEASTTTTVFTLVW